MKHTGNFLNTTREQKSRGKHRCEEQCPWQIECWRNYIHFRTPPQITTDHNKDACCLQNCAASDDDKVWAAEEYSDTNQEHNAWGNRQMISTSFFKAKSNPERKQLIPHETTKRIKLKTDPNPARKKGSSEGRLMRMLSASPHGKIAKR